MRAARPICGGISSHFTKSSGMRSGSACHATTCSRSGFGADDPRCNHFGPERLVCPVLPTVITTGDPHNGVHSTCHGVMPYNHSEIVVSMLGLIETSIQDWARRMFGMQKGAVRPLFRTLNRRKAGTRCSL